LARLDRDLYESSVIRRISNEKQLPATSVVLAWTLNQGIAFVAKSKNDQYLRENFDNVIDLTLSVDEIEEIAQLNQNRSFFSLNPWNVL
jgi:diketogulonate reductase-like aldo/keto reductase